MVMLGATYGDDHSGCRGHLIDLDHGEDLWHLSFTCTGIEEAGGG